jgi:hypothetical protein
MDNDFLTNTGDMVSKLLFKYRQAEDSMVRSKKSLEEAKEEQADTLGARVIVQEISKAVQQKVHQKIADIVDKCLSAVFEDSYEFKINFETKRGKTEANLVFVRDGIELDDPLNQVGGGVIDVASLALRLACILLFKPKRRKLLILDEPLKNVRGKEHRRRVRDLLQSLADELEVQIILNVDLDSYPEFSLGKIVEMGI